MQFTKIEQPQPLKDHAYEQIKTSIIHYKIEPGTTLYERSLSESLGISRTPLKMALQQLEFEGWIQSIPRKGIIVNSITKKDVTEIFELREANEVLVMKLLIPQLNQATLLKIEKKYEKLMKGQEDPAKIVLFDTEFHLYLAELSQNNRLYQLIKNLTDHFQWYGMAALKSGKSLDEINQEHGLIMEGLKARDLSQTKKAILDHIEKTYHIIMKNIQEE